MVTVLHVSLFHYLYWILQKYYCTSTRSIVVRG